MYVFLAARSAEPILVMEAGAKKARHQKSHNLSQRADLARLRRCNSARILSNNGDYCHGNVVVKGKNKKNKKDQGPGGGQGSGKER